MNPLSLYRASCLPCYWGLNSVEPFYSGPCFKFPSVVEGWVGLTFWVKIQSKNKSPRDSIFTPHSMGNARSKLVEDILSSIEVTNVHSSKAFTTFLSFYESFFSQEEFSNLITHDYLQRLRRNRPHNLELLIITVCCDRSVRIV